MLLLPGRAIYWPERQTLFLADMHLGKAAHFRKEGIHVPENVADDNFERMDQLLEAYAPRRIVVLGDMFHSAPNYEWRQFTDWKRRRLDPLGATLTLVKGNHDWAAGQFSDSKEIEAWNELHLPPFRLVHHADETPGAEESEAKHGSSLYTLGGHVHPAVKMRGKGRQQLTLPCFYFGRNYGLLPAFGAFTGTHILKPHPEDRVYLLLEDRVQEVS